MNIKQAEARVAQIDALLSANEARGAAIYDALVRENRSTTDDEAATVAELRSEKTKLVTERRQLEGDITEMRAAEDAAEGQPTVADLDEARQAVAAQAATRNTVAVKAEPLTYQKHDARSSYFMDLVLAETGRGKGDPTEARSRLQRHAQEMAVEGPKADARAAKAAGLEGAEFEARDLSRTDGSGGFFVPPLWMMNEWVSLLRAGRVTADLCRKMPLPPGTDSINVPKVATGTAVAIQTADNAAVQETDMTDTSVTANVKTIAGQQDLAMQLLEQSPLSFDQIMFQDLIADYALKLDQQVISGSNASGQVRGIRNIASVATVAYTDASPTVPELYPKIASAINTVNTTRYLPPQVLIMHPRRWLWILSSLDSSNRPLVVPNAQGPNNGLATMDSITPQGAVGYIMGVPVVTDPNIPTNVGAGTEDVIIAARPDDYYLWEGPLRTRVLQEVLSANLTVRLQVYAYCAFMPDRRPESTCIVTGTGLIAPTF